MSGRYVYIQKVNEIGQKICENVDNNKFYGVLVINENCSEGVLYDHAFWIS